jgi:thiamine biosynthesis lipoprotein
VEIGSYQDADFDAAFFQIAKIHNLLSYHDPNSDLSRLNSSAKVGSWIELNPLSVKVLRLARAVSLASNGLFNPTVGGELEGLKVLPSHQGNSALKTGTVLDIELEPKRARLLKPIRLTLDGIAKGFAVDLAIQTMRGSGVKNGWVNAGGDLRVFGDVTLPVQVRTERGFAKRILGLRNAAFATSIVREAPSETFPAWIVGSGELELRPKLGTWCVQARTAWRADALTKVASLLSEEKRASEIARLGGRWISEVELQEGEKT